MPLTRSARMTTPNHRSAAASATQIRCPPLLNCVALTFRSVSPHSFLTFSRSKTSRFSTVPRWLAEKGTDLSADLSTGREVEAAKVKCSFSSSKSQTLTDRTLNVSEISFAAAAQRLESSTALEVDCVNRVQISRKSYCGRLKCWLMKPLTRC